MTLIELTRVEALLLMLFLLACGAAYGQLIAEHRFNKQRRRLLEDELDRSQAIDRAVEDVIHGRYP